MNLARIFAALIALAVVGVLVAMVALISGPRSADSDIVVHAHGVLGTVARRISSAYSVQIASLRSEVSVPLAPATLDGYGRRVVIATIGDDEGVDGGLFLDAAGIVADAPQHVASSRERAAIAALARGAERKGGPGSATVTLASGDIVVLDAEPLADHSGVAWARERIAGSALHGARTQAMLVAAAAACCLILVALGAWLVWAIRRDAKRVLFAIEALEAEPGARPKLPGGDFGAIGEALAAMSQRRAAAEDVAQRNERLVAIGRLAAGAAHEIRNPLNSLRLQIDVLRRRMGVVLDEPSKKLRAEIDRLDTVVSGMLAVGSNGPVAAAQVDLRCVARRAIDVLEPDARARARSIDFAAPDVDIVVRGDEGRLVQLVINILANAIDAAPPGSAITIRVETGPALTIVDSGGGIAESEMAHLFEPFYTTKPAGTGLGLAIAHEIARAHGARIDVASLPGRTTFRIDFMGAQHAAR